MGLCYDIALIFSFKTMYQEEGIVYFKGQIVSEKNELKYYDKYIVRVSKAIFNDKDSINTNIEQGILQRKSKSMYNTKVILYVKKEEELSIGDTIIVNGEFQKGEIARNYKGFNYRNYLKQKKIYGIVYGKTILKKEHKISIYTIIEIPRSMLCKKLEQIYNKNCSAFLKGILLGDTNFLDDEIKENFRNSSTSHILAISGMHISYILIGIKFLLNKSKIDRNKQNWILIVFLGLFTICTGFSASCIRACIMNSMCLLSFNVNRKNNIYVSMCICFIIIIFINPFNFFNIGMWLSFGGKLGIILFCNFLSRFVNCKFKKFRSKKSRIKTLSKIFLLFIELAIVSISAQIIIIPIIIYQFNTISFSFFISNILISFIFEPVLILGYLSIFISFIFLPFARLLALVESGLIFIIINLSQICGKIPLSKIYVKTPYVVLIIIYYFIIYFFICRKYYSMRLMLSFKFFKSQVYKFRVVLIIFFIITLILSNLNKFDLRLKIYFVDVGQGDCTVVVTPRGKNIIIDGGEGNSEKYDYGEKVLLPYLLDRGITKIDYLIISHGDSDHIGGLFAIIKNLKVDKIFIGLQSEECSQIKALINLAKEKKIEIKALSLGDSIEIEKNIKIEVLWPKSNNLIAENTLNNNSLVLKLKYRNFSMLFTGDIEEIAEKEILKTSADLEANILKVAHHGSKTSSTEEFLKSVKPQIVLIGVGADNKFGHPNSSIIERLQKLGSKVYRTDQTGEVEIKVNKIGNIMINTKI